MEDPSQGGSELIGSSDGRLVSDAMMITKEEVKLIVISTLGEVILPVIGDLTRNIVKEEIQIALQKIKTDKDWNNALAVTMSAERRSLQLKFLDEVSLPDLTGEEFKGKGGAAIRLAIIDTTGKLVDSGPEASAKIEILLLQADPNDNEHSWSIDDFSERIIGRQNKQKPHFSEDTYAYLHLHGGEGILCNVKLGHGSMWMKDCLCRLGARVVDNFSESTVKEARTESFMVQDCRRNYNKKKQIPSPSDKTWRLHNIWRGGKIDQRLQHENIYTVEDLLIRLLKDYNGLKNIVGLVGKKWEDMVKNARACPSDKRMCYINSLQNSGVVFDIHGVILGLYTERQYDAAQILSEKNKVTARELFSSAIGHWEDIIQFDDESSLQQHLTSLLKPVDQSDPLELGYSIGPHHRAASEPDCPFQGIISNMASTQEIGMECVEPSFSTDDVRIYGTDFMLTEPFVARDRHGEKDDTRELVISAFRNRDRIPTFDDASTSTSSYLSVVPSVGQDLSSHKIGKNTYSQPNAAFPDCMQSVYSMGGAWNCDDCLHVTDPPDIWYDHYSNFPSPDIDMDSVPPPLWNDNLQFDQIVCPNSSADLQCDIDAFVAGSVSPDGAKWGWNVLIRILGLCFSLKRNVARKTRVQEIPIYCY